MQFHTITPHPAFSPTDFSAYAARVAHLRLPLADPDLSIERLWQALPAQFPAQSLAARLRCLRHTLIGQVMAADLAGALSLQDVTEALTSLAEFTCQQALQAASAEVAERHGQPCNAAGEPQDLLVVGMGKLGGRELNVSSDIDLIFIYPESGETTGRSPGQGVISNHEFFTKVGQRLIPLLADVTAEGFVFRVDMRLRPYGDSGPLVMSFDMLEAYLIDQGREWERYAWIKGRVISQAVFMSVEAQQAQVAALEALVQPFVFRKYLDFGAIDAIRSLHAQIQAEVTRRELRSPARHAQLQQSAGQALSLGNNIKLGQGGIRQIEFLAQAFQLIRGGRDSGLRIRPTCDVLEACASRGLIESDIVEQLCAAYRFLRQVEHRLQYPEDAQTHTLPSAPDAQQALASSMGFHDYPEFLNALHSQRQFVQQQFASMFGEKTNDAAPPTWESVLDAYALASSPSAVCAALAESLRERIEGFLQSTRLQSLSSANRLRCEQLLPTMLQQCLALTAPADPLASLNRWLNFLDAISRRSAYLALLTEYPQAVQRVTNILAASEWAAQYLQRHPILLDELLDNRNLLAPPNWSEVEKNLAHELTRLDAQAVQAGIEPTEQAMDALREVHHAQIFRLMAQDLEGQWSPEALSDQLSALADLILRQTLAQCWVVLKRRYRDSTPALPDTPHFAIIAYGKLGGKELGYASDLDLIFLYDDPHPDAGEYYAKLAQRITTWLSSQTPAGILFEVDLRLRPNGNAGLLVSSLEAFKQYQHDAAWVWEHQALTRARFCVGDAAIGEWFEAERRALLQLARDPLKLREEVIAMRQKMLDGHPNRSSLFDLKHDRGGMVDIEFMVQYLVLREAAQYPALLDNVGNIALLKRAAQVGLISDESARLVSHAYRVYRSLQHGLRLQGHEHARVAPSHVHAEQRAVQSLWQTLLGDSAHF